MIELKDYQRIAVNDLKRKVIKNLNRSGFRKKIVLQAPTGAGKTVIASAMLDELKAEVEQSGECYYDRVAFIWLAPNKLHIQSYKSLRNYFSETHNLRTLMFEEIDASLGYLSSGDILFLNWESINKENAILRRENEQNHNLSTLVRRTVEKDIPIIVVIDEEHYYTGANARKSEEVLKLINPKIELRISATPITTNAEMVQISRDDVIDEEMIKKRVELNPNVSGNDRLGEDLTVNQQLLEKALRKRNELAKAYKAMGVDINPLLLIQLPNDSKETLTSEDLTVRDEVVTYLDNVKNINVNNEKLAIWLSDNKDKLNLENITKKNSNVDCLLFKQAISKGWDCPRAAVLVIYRTLSDVKFTIQTMGRILRMPEQRFYSDERLNVGYVYTNLSADAIIIAQDEMNYINKSNAYLKDDIQNIVLPNSYPNKNKKQHFRLGYDFRAHLKKEFSKEFDIQDQTIDFDYGETEDNEELLKLFGGEPGQKVEDDSDKYGENRLKVGNKGIQVDVTRLFLVVPRNIILADPDRQSRVEVQTTARLSRNTSESSQLFTLFCRAHVAPFQKFDSTPVLRGALISFAAEYLGLMEDQAIRMYLGKANVRKWEDLIKRTLIRYEKIIRERFSTEAAASSIKTDGQWTLPDARSYNIDTFINKDKQIRKHALRPYYEDIEASEPEKHFALFIDHSDAVDWWYKNGDMGSEHFAVPYKDSGNRDSLFYVDFIISLKSGTILLLDTKTKGSDPEAPNKHNGLRLYMARLNEKGMKLKGGIIIEQGANWYYPELDIQDTTDLTGWTALDLNRL
jgi:type III restriction enzyme